MQMCGWESVWFYNLPIIFWKSGLDSRCFFFFFFHFSLNFKDWSQKMVEFIRQFIDRRVKQKIWFECGLQIWFVCGFAIGWVKISSRTSVPPKNVSIAANRTSPSPLQRCHISEFILNSEFFHSQFPQFYLFLARFGSICPNLRIFSEFLSGTHWHLCHLLYQ